MKSMKKLIAISLVVVMLVALAVPTVFADDLGVTISNTSQLFNENEYILNGGQLKDGKTITMGGTTRDEDWQYAYTLNKKVMNGGYEDKLDFDVYIVWDANYLYILEERHDSALATTATKATDTNAWSAFDSIMYNFLLPNAVSADKSAYGAQVAVYNTVTAATDGSTAVGKNLVAVRDFTYTTSTGTKGGWNDKTWDNENSSGIMSYSRVINATTHEIETRIPWSVINGANAAYTPAANNVVGFLHYTNTGSGSAKYHTMSTASDFKGFARLVLRESNAGVIKPDIEWANNYDINSTDVIEISTAAQLLALSRMSNNHKYYTNKNTGAAYTDSEFSDKMLRNKKFVLTADIDLNPGWNANGNELPYNVWQDLHYFSGTFDGQGHTISGCYNGTIYGSTVKAAYDSKGAPTQAPYRDRGFFSRIYDFTEIKNFSFVNSKLEANNCNVGSIVGATNENVRGYSITNIYVECNIISKFAGGWSYAGGIIGKEQKFTESGRLENLVFKGDITIASGSASGCGSAGIRGSGSQSNDAPKEITNNLMVITNSTMNSNFTTGGNRSELNCILYKNGAVVAGKGANDEQTTTYPTGWVNIDEDNANVKMPASVAAMVDSNLWAQERINENSMDIRILTVLGSKENTWDSYGIKVEIELDGQFVEIPGGDAFKSGKVYTSINAAGVKKDASELGGKYVGGIVLTNSPKTVKLRITPVKYVGEQAYYGGSSVVSYVDGIMQ